MVHLGIVITMTAAFALGSTPGAPPTGPATPTDTARLGEPKTVAAKSACRWGWRYSYQYGKCVRLLPFPLV